MMEFEKDKIEDLTNRLKTSVQANIDLLKLEVVERTSVLGSSVVILLLLGFVAFLFLLFASLTAGFYLSHCFKDEFTGFALVAGFYLLLTLLLLVFRKKCIEIPLRNKIIRSLFKKD